MKSSIPQIILRSLLGLVFLVFGLNKFLNFIPSPPEPPAAMEFFGALFKTGYFLPLLASFEVISGILLLTGMMVPLALAMLAPIIVNIFMFHLFLAPGGLPIVAVLVVLELVLAWMHRDAFAPLFSTSGSAAASSSIREQAHA